MNSDPLPVSTETDRRAQEALDDVVRSIVKPSLDEVLAAIAKDSARLGAALENLRRLVDDSAASTSRSIRSEVVALRDEAEGHASSIQGLLASHQTAHQESLSTMNTRLTDAVAASHSLHGLISNVSANVATVSRVADDTQRDVRRYQRAFWVVAGLIGLLSTANLVLTAIWHN